MTLNNQTVRSHNARVLENAEYPTPLLSSFPGSLSPGVVAPDRVLSMGQIELNRVLMLNWIVYMDKMDLALNNLQ